MYSVAMPAPFGTLTLTEQDGKLIRVDFGAVSQGTDDTPLLREARAQLEAYFAGRLRNFDLPLAYTGTPFREHVWAALCDIPYGEMRNYGQIAAAIGQPTACRAVGGAIHHNPISIIIPCHRVIGADGSLTGFGGGIPIKTWLLDHERKQGSV